MVGDTAVDVAVSSAGSHVRAMHQMGEHGRNANAHSWLHLYLLSCCACCSNLHV